MQDPQSFSNLFDIFLQKSRKPPAVGPWPWVQWVRRSSKTVREKVWTLHLQLSRELVAVVLLLLLLLLVVVLLLLVLLLLLVDTHARTRLLAALLTAVVAVDPTVLVRSRL